MIRVLCVASQVLLKVFRGHIRQMKGDSAKVRFAECPRTARPARGFPPAAPNKSTGAVVGAV